MDIMNDTTPYEYYGDAEMTFTEVFAIVRYKIQHNKPLTSPKQEMMKKLVEEWVYTFGAESLK